LVKAGSLPDRKFSPLLGISTIVKFVTAPPV